MINRRKLLALSSPLCAWALPSASLLAAEKLPVVASFSILADFVAQVGGDRVNVASLVPPGADTHVYQPSPGDARKLGVAKVIVINGFGLEGWMERLIAASGTKAPVIVATKGIRPREDKQAHEGVDPHAWQSIANARLYVVAIRDGLSAADPKGASLYGVNAASYLAKLDALEAQVRAAIERIPPPRRRIITSHDAFGYFGAAYGFSFIAPQGVSTESEASAKDVASIIKQIRAEKIPAVFLENMTDPRLAQQLAQESGTKIGGTLYSDSLSKPDGPAATYISMMQNNLRELEKALVQ